MVTVNIVVVDAKISMFDVVSRGNADLKIRGILCDNFIHTTVRARRSNELQQSAVVSDQGQLAKVNESRFFHERARN